MLSPTSSTRSKGTTQSAPSGIGAPVISRTAVPGTTATLPMCPAWTVSVTDRTTGASGAAPRVSALLRA